MMSEEGKTIRIGGSLFLTTGILAFIGFLLTSLAALLFNIELLKELDGSAKLAPIAGVLAGVTGFIISIFILLIVLKAKNGLPIKMLKLSGLIWSILLIIITILTTVFAIVAAKDIGSYSRTSINSIAFISSIIILVGIILSKQEVGEGIFNWASLLLIGIALLYTGSQLFGGLNDTAYLAGSNIGRILTTGIIGFESIITLTSPGILVALFLSILGIAVGKHYKNYFPRIPECLTLLGFLYLGIDTLRQATASFSPYWSLLREKYMPTLIKAASGIGIVAGIIMLIVSILVIILAVEGIRKLPLEGEVAEEEA